MERIDPIKAIMLMILLITFLLLTNTLAVVRAVDYKRAGDGYKNQASIYLQAYERKCRMTEVKDNSNYPQVKKQWNVQTVKK